jgi:hypothetical protein
MIMATVILQGCVSSGSKMPWHFQARIRCPIELDIKVDRGDPAQYVLHQEETD